jgi:hypothetical protein
MLIIFQVFCLSRNKITRLPSYMHRFSRLTVLKVERNPIEWPPKSVMDRPIEFSSAEAMEGWIRSVQKWIEVESASRFKGHDDSGFSELESSLYVGRRHPFTVDPSDYTPLATTAFPHGYDFPPPKATLMTGSPLTLAPFPLTPASQLLPSRSPISKPRHLHMSSLLTGHRHFT